MRVYIAGPMTGVEGYAENFRRAEKFISANGDVPINPVEMSMLLGSTEMGFRTMYFVDDGEIAEESLTRVESRECSIARATVKAELAVLETCDAIYLLDGWEQSRGAKKELAHAIGRGLDVYPERKAVQ